MENIEKRMQIFIIKENQKYEKEQDLLQKIIDIRNIKKNKKEK